MRLYRDLFSFSCVLYPFSRSVVYSLHTTGPHHCLPDLLPHLHEVRCYHWNLIIVYLS